MIEVDDIEYRRKYTYTPTQIPPRINRLQYQRPISPIGTTNEALFAVIDGEMGRPKNWVPKKLKKDVIETGTIYLQELCV